jgi:hypothetical protein
VLDDTLASLVERERVSAARARRLRTRLRRPGAGWPAAAELQPRDAARARELLAGAARRVERLALSDVAPEQLVEKLARIQRRGRKAMKAARRDRSVAALHEWRKQVKNCWHAFEALPTRGARCSRRAVEPVARGRRVGTGAGATERVPYGAQRFDVLGQRLVGSRRSA